MAVMTVTFRRGRAPGSSDNKPVARGSDARTEVVTIAGASAVTTLAADGESYASVRVGIASWVKIGPGTPVAAAIVAGANGTSFYMAADEVADFWVATGDKVAVILA